MVTRNPKGEKGAAPKRRQPKIGKVRSPTKRLGTSRSLRDSASWWWKEFWAYAGPASTIVGLWYTLTPSVSISSGVNLDQKQSMQTQFVVTNAGHVPVYNLRFSCTFRAYIVPPNPFSVGMDGDRLLARVDKLNAGHALSKGCFIQSNTSEGTILRVVVWYRWPIIHFDDQEIAYFSVRKGADGFFLVPDVEPDPLGPMALPPVPAAPL